MSYDQKVSQLDTHKSLLRNNEKSHKRNPRKIFLDEQIKGLDFMLVKM